MTKRKRNSRSKIYNNWKQEALGIANRVNLKKTIPGEIIAKLLKTNNRKSYKQSWVEHVHYFQKNNKMTMNF